MQWEAMVLETTGSDNIKDDGKQCCQMQHEVMMVRGDRKQQSQRQQEMITLETTGSQDKAISSEVAMHEANSGGNRK